MVKKIVCKICGQKFSRPGHLGRHLSATHGIRKSGGTTKTFNKVQKAAYSSATGGIDLGTDEAILSLRRYHDRLLAQQSDLNNRIAAVQAALNALGGNNGTALRVPATSASKPKTAKPKPASGGGQTGGMRPGSLKEYILRAVRSAGKPISIAEIEKAVLSAGYPTKSKMLINAINNTMSKVPGIRRIKRGVYVAK